MWHTVLITFTEISNFFELRCPQYRSYDGDSKVLFRSKKDFLKFKGCPNDSSDILYFLKHNESQAEIHIQALAESMWDAMNESVPKDLEAGEWHVPFGDRMQIPAELIAKYWGIGKVPFSGEVNEVLKVMIATARCARLSYMNFDGEINYEKDIELHDRLLQSGHYSPFEHCARAMDEDEYSTFFKGQVDCYYDNLLNKEILEYAPKETYGWYNNVRGWIQYRYLIENKQ